MNDGGPAFPLPDNRDYDGMTLRDYFAAKAMQALVIGVPAEGVENGFAQEAYRIADAMLAERDKGGKGGVS